MLALVSHKHIQRWGANTRLKARFHLFTLIKIAVLGELLTITKKCEDGLCSCSIQQKHIYSLVKVYVRHTSVGERLKEISVRHVNLTYTRVLLLTTD